MSSEISNALEQAFTSLTAEGKTPTVALIKSRLIEPLPMPLIIKALQAWKKNSSIPKIEKQQREISQEERIQQLEQQVAALSARLTALEQ